MILYIVVLIEYFCMISSVSLLLKYNRVKKQYINLSSGTFINRLLIRLMSEVQISISFVLNWTVFMMLIKLYQYLKGLLA